jgi:tetratricopeptide (TPR) repeat protein
MVESFRSRSLSRQMSADTSASLARGDELYEAGRYKEAAEQYEFFVTANAQKEDAQQQVAQGLLSLGRCQIRMDRLQEAPDSLAKCIRKAQEVGDGLMAGWAYCEFGLALEKTGQHESAIKSYKRAYTQAKDSHDRELECKAVTRMGRLLEDTGKHMEAKRLYERSIPSRKSPSRADTKMTMEITRRLGRVLYDLQRYAEAHEAYEDMRAAAKRLEDHVAQGFSEIGIAECCVAIGYVEVQQYCNKRRPTMHILYI